MIAAAFAIGAVFMLSVVSRHGVAQCVGTQVRDLLGPPWKVWPFPRMQRDEVLLIKCFDSATDGRARLAVHTAFEDPTTPDDAPPRESIEIRTFAFF